MDFTQTILDVIDFRSFSNFWLWIVLTVTWSTASHWVLGIPFDMVLRARRHGGQALTDLEDLVRINVNRLLYVARMSGLWLAAFSAFLLTALVPMAVWYQVELAQALALIMVPMMLVSLLSLSTARRIEKRAPEGEELCRILQQHRIWTQGIGVVSIFVTGMYGMYHNFLALYAI